MGFDKNINTLITDAKSIDFSKVRKSNFISYKSFIEYFKDIKGELTKHNLIIGINFTYGWMPTIFKFKNFELYEIVLILNKARNIELLNESELDIIRKCLNNSLVGTSKLLHFINPNKYPIWD